MHHSTPPSPDTTVSWSTIRVTGDDARTYLQGQLTADVGNRSATSLLLAPNSVVICDLHLDYNEHAVSLTLRSELVEATMQRLRRFVLRSNCAFELTDALVHPYNTLGEQVALGLAGPHEYARELTPHSFGLNYVEQHVSFTKGCFTGQELVGRLDARGANVPYRLVTFVAENADAAIEATKRGPDGGAQGVTTMISDGNEVRGLALVHRTLVDGEVDGVTVATVGGAR